MGFRLKTCDFKFCLCRIYKKFEFSSSEFLNGFIILESFDVHVIQFYTNMQQYVLNNFQIFFFDEVTILHVTSSFPKDVPKKNIFPQKNIYFLKCFFSFILCKKNNFKLIFIFLVLVTWKKGVVMADWNRFSKKNLLGNLY